MESYVDKIWSETKTTQKTIEQLSRNTSIKQLTIKDDIVRYVIAEWLKNCGINIKVYGDQIVFR